VTTTEARKHKKAPIWRNGAVLKWVAQIMVLISLLLVAWLLGSRAATNFSNSGINFNFDWLSDPPGISIREGIDLTPTTGAKALVVGIINTLRIAISGIIAATILGTLIGVFRLSSNFIVNKVAAVYIETIRNIPLLVQIFFWQALIIGLTGIAETDVGDKWVHLSNKGVALAWAFPSVGFWQWLMFVIFGGIAAFLVARWRKRYQERTGKASFALTYAGITFLLFMFIGWFAHPIFGFLGGFWGAVSSFIDSLPTWLIPGLLAALVLLLAARWIWNFFAARKTPAGYGKFSDDDVFRVVFAAVGSILVALLLLWIGNQVVQTTQGSSTVGEQLRDGLSNLFLWAETRFTGDSGAPIDWQRAAVELRGTGGFVQYSASGIVITPPFFAIWIGVTLYTASFIAEIVRGGILAVSKGQTEASQAVGLTRSQYLRLIILPQAFRIIMPPLGNQYLNLAKNTSLGLAVAYADIVSVGNTLINQTGQSLPVILVWMAFFLTLSLTISAIVNYYNRKLKLVER
jgi:general L-amino acid transport system permease protein